ncbi:MAG: phytanoyl-CoA dioxygenase family protein [Gammaproteobacteria bacterium]|nr:phytanoyl-CoA dioxygenase family protein [Gammaproteobacteria bacterium]
MANDPMATTIQSEVSEGSLNSTQLDQYRERGYVVLTGALDGTTLARLRKVTDEIVQSAHGVSKHTDTLDLESTHTPERPRVRRIKRPHVAHPFYDQLARDPRITEAIVPLIGPDIRMRPAGKINMKAGGYGSPVEWHQDWAFYPHTNQDVLAVGILLDDMDANNGPIMFIPGSHKGPIYDHHSDGAFCGAIDVSASKLDVSQAVEVHATAGSLTIHHARLVHGSALNRSNRSRRILLYEFAAADAWPLAGVEPMRDIEEFNGRIVCGEPTLQPRMEDVPVRMPLPIAKHQGSIYENQRSLSTRYFEEFRTPN